MRRVIILTAVACLIGAHNINAQKTRECYELRVYSFTNPAQEKLIDSYLKDAFIPAMHKLGSASIGVFKPAVESDSTFGKRIYVLVPYASLQKFHEAKTSMIKDWQSPTQGKDYVDAPHNNPPYKRMESILLYAFEKHPTMQKPKLTSQRSERIYELRSYEGPTEKKNDNKIKMFNDGDEIGLFARLNFNAVFYAEVYAGSRMPNLMYMTTFDNMLARDIHWRNFSNDPQWEKLKAMPEYQNNVSKADILLLRPTKYSDY